MRERSHKRTCCGGKFVSVLCLCPMRTSVHVYVRLMRSVLRFAILFACEVRQLLPAVLHSYPSLHRRLDVRFTSVFALFVRPSVRPSVLLPTGLVFASVCRPVFPLFVLLSLCLLTKLTQNTKPGCRGFVLVRYVILIIKNKVS
jgi:hypothetical protein